jgi:serine/threonine-protein kinase HipA
MIRGDPDAIHNQAMTITGSDRRSNLALCVKAAPSFQLSGEQAAAIVTKQASVIRELLPILTAEARLTAVEQEVLRSVMLHPLTFKGWVPLT